MQQSLKSKNKQNSMYTLTSALLSAFFKSCNKNSALFLGHLPCECPKALA